MTSFGTESVKRKWKDKSAKNFSLLDKIQIIIQMKCQLNCCTVQIYLCASSLATHIEWGVGETVGVHILSFFFSLSLSHQFLGRLSPFYCLLNVVKNVFFFSFFFFLFFPLFFPPLLHLSTVNALSTRNF